MNCRYCGAPLNPEVKFCSTCGRSQQEEVCPARPCRHHPLLVR